MFTQYATQTEMEITGAQDLAATTGYQTICANFSIVTKLNPFSVSTTFEGLHRFTE